MLALLLIVGLRQNTGAKVQASEYRVREESFENIIEITGNVLGGKSRFNHCRKRNCYKGLCSKGDVAKGQVIIELDASEKNMRLQSTTMIPNKSE